MSLNPITKTNNNNQKSKSKGKAVDKGPAQRALQDDNASQKDDGNTTDDHEGDVNMDEASDKDDGNAIEEEEKEDDSGKSPEKEKDRGKSPEKDKGSGSKPSKDPDSLSEFEIGDSFMDLDDDDHYMIKTEEELEAILAQGKRITKGMLGRGNPVAVSLAYCRQEVARCEDEIEEGITTLTLAEVEQINKEKEDFERRIDILMKSSKKASSDAEKAKTPSLGSIVKNVTAFLAGMPPLQVKGDGQAKHKTKMPKFTTIGLFYDEFEMYLECHDVPVEDHWEIIDVNNVETYEQLKEVLLPFYTSEYEELYHLLHIRYLTQKKLQLDLRNFAIHLQQYARQHHIDDDKTLLLDFLRNIEVKYRKACWDAVMDHRKKHKMWPNMLDMICHASEIQDALRMSKTTDRSKSWNSLGEYPHGSDDEDEAQATDEESEVERAPSKKRKRTRRSQKPKKTTPSGQKPKDKQDNHTCKLHGAVGHSTDDCITIKKAKKRFENPCHFCYADEYVKGKHFCTQMAKHNEEKDAERNQYQAKFIQLKRQNLLRSIDDHELMNTPSKNDKKQCKKETIYVRGLAKENADQSILLPIVVQDIETMALLDTGCSHSLVDKAFAKANKFHITPTTGSFTLAVDGMTAQRTGSIQNVKVTYGDRKFEHTFELIDLPDPKVPIYAGMDILSKMGIGITGLNSAWPSIIAPSEVDSTVVDPQKEEPNNSPAGTDAERKIFFDRIEPLIIKNKQIPTTSFCTLPESVVRLDTGDAPPVHKRQNPIAVAMQPILQETIDRWLHDGTIEEAPADSKWNSPLTFAPKKDAYGKYTGKRPCLDPRGINNLIQDDTHPLPLICDIFNSLDGAQVFTTLDLKSAFHRFEIHPDDRHKTTFTVGRQRYMFRGCPFGLKPISSKFQRVMDIIFKPMEAFVLCFVDDIVIFSKNMEHHVEHVARAIQALTKVNLILNAEKCHFAQQSVYLLGFCVSAAGRSLDPRKLTNIQNWPIPQTGKDIQRFLGVINYFREHIPNVSTITAPLDELRNQDKLHSLWTDCHTDAFNALQNILPSTPILRYPNLDHPFSVATDASNVGIGAVLYQVIDGETRHISFMARSLSKSQRNYSTTKRELLAVVYALEKFHTYLWGNKFTLYTDHRALTYLHTQRVANSMMVGWLDSILSYNFEVVHLHGLDNILPDQLSRLFPTAKELEGGNDGDIAIRAVDANQSTSQEVDLDQMFEPPEEERKQLLIQYHLFGHFGAKAIVKALHADERLSSTTPYTLFLPADHWAIDLAGPFRPTHDNNTYLLVMVDICTRYCVLRPIPNKQSDTIVKALIQVFGDYGFPRYLQSDNGTEFVNQLVKKLSEATGFDHRLVTPYHPRANGVAERWVQTSVKTLRKLIKGAVKDWDMFVPAMQLSINAKFSERHESAPYTLMFARKMNTFDDYRSEEDFRPMTNEELQDRLDTMEKVVFPAINKKVLAVLDAQKKSFDKKHVLVDFPVNSEVVIVVPKAERSKLDTPHDGPFRVAMKTKGGSYELMDSKGNILERNYAPSQLKLISQDYDLPCDDMYTVDRIMEHKKVPPESSFTNVQSIHDYWKSIEQEPEQKLKEKGTNKTKKTKRGNKRPQSQNSVAGQNQSRKRKQQPPMPSMRKSPRFQ